MIRAAVVLSAAIVLAAGAADRLTGLSATYFSDLNWTMPAASTVDHVVGSDSILQQAPFTPNVSFSASWSGYWFVPRTGDYTFEMTSFSEASLSIGPPVDRQGDPVSIAVPGATVHLDAGVHPLAIAHRHPDGLYGLDIRVAPAGGRLERLSPASLSRRPLSPLAYRGIAALGIARTLVLTAWLAAALAWIARRVRWPVLVALVATTAAFVLAVAYDWPERLRGPAPFPPEWQWLHVFKPVWLGVTP